MKILGYISLFLLAVAGQIPSFAQNAMPVEIEFCGEKLDFTVERKQVLSFDQALSAEATRIFYYDALQDNYSAVIKALKDYKQKYNPDDWLFYQLIRKTAQHISPKEKNYYQYTLYKWFFLSRSGYDAILTLSQNKMLFYVRCDENIYNIPTRIVNGKQYVCLNYHDYGSIDFEKEIFTEAGLPGHTIENTFSYKIKSIPDFKATEYLEKDLHFSFYENDYHFKVKLSPQIQRLFTNYPVVDYESYLNIPLSRETYNSLIPQLKNNLKGMSKKNGVDYLMRFTRYAFLFEPDSIRFGGEKRLSPEQTLLYDQSDCEDRVALFFYLVREIYDLPMIVLSFPTHVAIAVQFDKPIGTSITYNGKKYSVCDPTPQKEDLLVGQLLPGLRKTPYQIAYVYQPRKD